MMATVYIEQEAAQMIELYVASVDTEIAGMGYVELVDGFAVVRDVFLLGQTVTGASVDVDKKAVAAAMDKAKEDGRLDQLRFSWHSHADMKCYFSATDTENIENYAPASWFVSAVYNRKGQSEARIDFFEPVRAVAPATIETLFGSELVELVSSEIKVHVKEPKPKTSDNDRADALTAPFEWDDYSWCPLSLEQLQSGGCCCQFDRDYMEGVG